MEEIEDFFNFTKDFKREQMPRGAVSGNVSASVNESRSAMPIKREFVGSKYAFAKAEEEQRRMDELEMGPSSRSAMDTMDDMENCSDDDETVEATRAKIYKIDDGVYSRYVFDMQRDSKLPIYEARERILETIKENRVVVLEGDTGCGKTTQVPQYIIDDAYRNNVYCKICITQPRRIAAISIAQRVSKERKWDCGTVVGYKVGLHQDVSEDTRIVYCTTGVLLQQLINEKNLNQYTHIILDEVHERDQDMDFLLIVVRRMLSTVSKHVKIILMSATIDTKQFANYFKIGQKPAPSLRVDTRRMFSVKEFYLNSLSRINKNCITVNYEDPSISIEMFNLCLRLILVIENIESTEMQNNPILSNVNASILIFLPGINEINEMTKLLEGLNETKDALHNIKLFPIRLHSMVDPTEQCKIFQRAPSGYRKIILATNIAESSITVPDVKYVIDFCLTKFLKTDSSTNFSSLVLSWASKANCRQRAGRAGRVMSGRVYRLVPKEFYDTMLDEYSTPEMLRCPLETIVLKSKLLDMGAPPDVLALAMDAPNLSDVQNTILSLKEVGALFKFVGKEYSEIDGDLTFMGRVMAAMPLDVRLTRLVLLGYMFSTLEECIIIAAGLSVRSVFISTNKRLPAEPYIQKLSWADASGSDLFAIYKAYKVWQKMKENNPIRDEEEISWAKRYFINLRSMREMRLTVMEITKRLNAFNIKTHSYNRVHWVEREMSIVLKVVIAGAFYPHYFTRSSLNDLDRERSMYHILCGRDPCNTVYFTGFSSRNIGQLYTKSIKDLFFDLHIPPEMIEVNFQPGSERVFVTFKSNQNDESASSSLMVPGHVCSEVYKAVRMRMESLNTTINVMETRAAIAYAEKEGMGRVVEGVWMPKLIPLKNAELIVLPSVFQRTVRVQITHIESCSKFFARPLTELARMNELTDQLNCRELERCRFREPKEVDPGTLLAAPFEGKYHRARFITALPKERKSHPFKVYFLDYGNTSIVDFTELRYFPRSIEDVMQETPPRIFECRLANIQPSTIQTSLCRWPDDAMELLQQIADHNPVDLQIYSVVSFVANVIIQTTEGSSLNDLLIKKGYARVADENYLSKMDHDLRRRKQSCSGRFLDHDHIKQNEEYIRSMHTDTYQEMPAPPRQLCMRRLNLRGPFSPVETKVYSAIRIGHWKTVSVERDSVNSVLIDTDPQDIHDRLMVAADVTETMGQSTMTLRQTTLMPNIHGFGALVTMMFAPQFQLKCNKSQSKYVALLAGLGYHQDTMKPYFEEHDIVLTLDIEITEEDLTDINHLRYCMDTILFTSEGENHPAVDEKNRGNLQAKIKDLVISIFSRNRQYVEAHMDKNDSVWEQQLCKIGRKCIYSPRSIFPTLKFMDLMDEKFENINILSNHCKQLHKMAQFDAMVQGGTTCRLCNLVLENIVQLRIHLLSQLHRDRERQIHFDKTRN